MDFNEQTVIQIVPIYRVQLMDGLALEVHE